MDYRKIITTDPQIRNGRPCIRGLPITVAEVLGYLASGMTIEQVLAKHVKLTREDIVASLKFAAESFGDFGDGAAPISHSIPPKPRNPTATSKKLVENNDA